MLLLANLHVLGYVLHNHYLIFCHRYEALEIRSIGCGDSSESLCVQFRGQRIQGSQSGASGSGGSVSCELSFHFQKSKKSRLPYVRNTTHTVWMLSYRSGGLSRHHLEQREAAEGKTPQTESSKSRKVEAVQEKAAGGSRKRCSCPQEKVWRRSSSTQRRWRWPTGLTLRLFPFAPSERTDCLSGRRAAVTAPHAGPTLPKQTLACSQARGAPEESP